MGNMHWDYGGPVTSWPSLYAESDPTDLGTFGARVAQAGESSEGAMPIAPKGEFGRGTVITLETLSVLSVLGALAGAFAGMGESANRGVFEAVILIVGPLLAGLVGAVLFRTLAHILDNLIAIRLNTSRTAADAG